VIGKLAAPEAQFPIHFVRRGKRKAQKNTISPIAENIGELVRAGLSFGPERRLAEHTHRGRRA
jgi:hypothetical protein